MLDYVKKRVQPSHFVLLAVLLVALMMGVLLPVLVGTVGDKYGKLASLPGVLIIGIMLLYNRKSMMVAIILLRAGSERVLGSSSMVLGGIPLGLGAMVNAFVILIALLLLFEKPKEVPRSVFWMWGGFLLLTLGGILRAPDVGEGVRMWLGQLSNFAVFISAFYLVRTRADFVFCVKLVLYSSIIPLGYSFVDFGLHHGADFRLKSTFGHPNIMAFYLSLCIALAFYMFKTLPGKLPGQHQLVITRYHLLYACYIVLALAMLMLTKTRSAWLACGLSFVLYGLLFERRYLVYLCCAAMLGLLVPGVADRLVDLDSGNQVGSTQALNSFAWRVYLWRSGLNWMEPSHYPFGYGLTTFKYYSDTFFPLAGTIKWNSHSVYVQLAFEIGAIGLASYFFLYGKVLQMLGRLWKIDRLASFSLILVILNFLICAASDNMLDYLSFNWYLWFSAGAGCSLAYAQRATARPRYEPGRA